ncbi:ARPP-1 family domain-containing protein [Kordia sp.]|uniref:ARPP-1 family domain-containing protein n=1 Tax=Kordia sp. TaxID=1965332 RepID=UPI003B5C2949
MSYIKYTLIIFFCLSFITVSAQMNSDNLKVVTKKQNSFKNLQLIPIKANNTYKKAYQNIGKYDNLKKAIESGKIEISDSGNVNTLIATNNSNVNIYIIAGEVVKGGKQDRLVAEDVIIAPGEKKNIPAFCVEQNRWHQKESGNAFKGYYNVSSKKVRQAALVDKDQSKVWANVAETTQKNSASSSTGTYAELEKSKTYTKDLSSYLNFFKNKFVNDTSIVGVIAISGDKIIGCDIFATHNLFKNSYQGLLHSYITEAITNGSKPTLSNAEVSKYYQNFMKIEAEQEKKLQGKGNVFRHKNKKLHLTSF